jgi:serine/threonine protein kinase
MGKPKPFGGRWRTTGAGLGQGGQGQVLRAVDESRQLEGEYALKLVLNPERHERFRAEIDAIRKLRHRNIIPLIDHSALAASAGGDGRQYLVMPIAAGGSLADPSRFTPYRENIEGTLQVSLQLAAALDAAHTAGIIHRDVKPANVLFRGNGHDIWLSDFGICLIRGVERNTELHEVVGPRSFMAPELEAGGQLIVTPAADIYSLGKVIYFMISGGTTLPREELGDPRFAQIFDRGDRYRRLQLLLDQMICQLDRRLKSVRDVAAQLEAIEAWERTAVPLPMDPTTRDAISKLQGRALHHHQAAVAAAAARTSREELVARVRQAFLSWAESELTRVATHIATPQLAARASPLPMGVAETPPIRLSERSLYDVIAGWELVLETSQPARGHALQLLLCAKRTVTVGIAVGARPRPSPEEGAPELAVLSACARAPSARGRGAAPRLWGYLTQRNSIGRALHVTPALAPSSARRIRPTYPGRSGQRAQFVKLERVAVTFRPEHSLNTAFRADEWNVAVERVRTQLQEAIGVFIDFVAEERPSIGS